MNFKPSAPFKNISIGVRRDSMNKSKQDDNSPSKAMAATLDKKMPPLKEPIPLKHQAIFTTSHQQVMQSGRMGSDSDGLSQITMQ